MLSAILRSIRERLGKEAQPHGAGKLWLATFLLTGLRITPSEVLPLFQGVHGMHASSTYQYILDEGAIREAKRILMRLGRKRFGPPSEAVGAALELIGDLERLEHMTERVAEVASWQELLSTP